MRGGPGRRGRASAVRKGTSARRRRQELAHQWAPIRRAAFGDRSLELAHQWAPIRRAAFGDRSLELAHQWAPIRRAAFGGRSLELARQSRRGYSLPVEMPRPAPRLGLWSGVGVNIGTMIGTGVFVSAGFMAETMSFGLILLAWLVGGVLAMAGARAYAAVAELVP